MGTDYWLVDREGKNALDVDRWYALAMQPEYDGCMIDYEDCAVTLDTIRRVLAPLPGERAPTPRSLWLVALSTAWMEDVAQGRTVILRTHDNDDEWVDQDCASDAPMPGWTLWSLFEPRSPHTQPWAPREAVAARRALDP